MQSAMSGMHMGNMILPEISRQFSMDSNLFVVEVKEYKTWKEIAVNFVKRSLELYDQDPEEFRFQFGAVKEVLQDGISYLVDFRLSHWSHLSKKLKLLVPLATTMHPLGNVENWLSEVEKKMKESILNQINLSLAAYKTSPRTDWVQVWPGQVVICGSSVYWTLQVEAAISKGNLQEYFDNVQVKN
eukprot:Gb_31257 [translate_table: standard]